MTILTTPHFVLKTLYFVDNNGQPSYQRAIPADLRRFFSNHKKITRKLTGKHTSFALEIARLAREDSKLFAELRGKAGVGAQVEAKARALLAYYGVRPGDGLIHMDVPSVYFRFHPRGNSPKFKKQLWRTGKISLPCWVICRLKI